MNWRCESWSEVANAMEGRKRKGYAWAFLAGLTAALAAISAKLFTSQVPSFILYPIFLCPIFCSISLDFTLIPYIWSNLYFSFIHFCIFCMLWKKKKANLVGYYSLWDNSTNMKWATRTNMTNRGTSVFKNTNIYIQRVHLCIPIFTCIDI